MRKKKLIFQSDQDKDNYAKLSNSNNHAQMEALEEFAMEEDMIETQQCIEDVQLFNTQNFYNRQHYAGCRVVPMKDENE